MKCKRRIMRLLLILIWKKYREMPHHHHPVLLRSGGECAPSTLVYLLVMMGWVVVNSLKHVKGRSNNKDIWLGDLAEVKREQHPCCRSF